MNLASILTLCTTIGLVSSCDDEWALFNGHCYRRFNSPLLKMYEANGYCRKHGANLTTVLDENERKFLFDFTTTGINKDRAHQTLVGAYRDRAGMGWKWFDGTPFTQDYLFKYGEPLNGDSVVLRSDPFDVNGPYAGYLGTAFDTSPAHVMVCKKRQRKQVSKCEEKWTANGANCYRRFSSPQTLNGNANSICKQHGSTLTSILTEAERRFVSYFANTGFKTYPYQTTVVGGYRESTSHSWKWYDGQPFEGQQWFVKSGTMKTGNRLCLRLQSEEPAVYPSIHGRLIDQFCHEKAWVLVCKKPANLICDSKTMTKENGQCTCNSDYVDIVDTDSPEAKDFSRGEKCVKGVCHSVKDSTSILFMIDSSHSITDKHWPSMVKFVKQGASKLPNSFRVGFMKFSTKVSDKKWIEPKWTKREYESSVPAKYDSGMTNTPLALQEAKKMFEDDDNNNKIAVLITDGMPFAEEYESEVEALNATIKAARKLRRDGVRLTVMGVGPELQHGTSKIAEWLKNPKNDYFYFHDTVDCLKGTDMDKLLQVACKNY